MTTLIDPHVAVYTRMVASSVSSFLDLLITETRRGSVVWVPESEAPAAHPDAVNLLADLGL
jgi:hypothetical protein